MSANKTAISKTTSKHEESQTSLSQQLASGPARTATQAAEAHARFETLSRHIEVLLHASETPLTDNQLKKHLSLSQNELDTALLVLQQRLANGVLQLNKSATGYRLQIADQYSSLIQQVFPQRLESLSQALLETLSVIAYKQPVTRSDIEQIRGVTVSSNILRQLFDKGWIVEKGFKDTLGRPALLHTTSEFLDAFGLESLEQLPPLPDLTALSANE
ncbi:SMC-Scp complex subunit ScpB [Psychrobacter pygoscelis]|uniref:SMC-Scp complex subunit ScpB n=1 Tax=Psychrobacter pygoscelis TaxID=2488563 RepID=UPI00104036FC|nr:SMC-Scp complex subunit ScpB [Psychrobacter pygoscelis]